jgi:hypothetical protein
MSDGPRYPHEWTTRYTDEKYCDHCDARGDLGPARPATEECPARLRVELDALLNKIPCVASGTTQGAHSVSGALVDAALAALPPAPTEHE